MQSLSDWLWFITGIAIATFICWYIFRNKSAVTSREMPESKPAELWAEASIYSSYGKYELAQEILETLETRFPNSQEAIRYRRGLAIHHATHSSAGNDDTALILLMAYLFSPGNMTSGSQNNSHQEVFSVDDSCSSGGTSFDCSSSFD